MNALLLLTAGTRSPARVVHPSPVVPLVRLVDGFYVDLGIGRERHGLFLLDTGSYRSFATARGASLLREAGATRELDGSWTVARPSVGGYPLPSMSFAPSAFFDRWLDHRAVGVVGLDLLARYRVILDLKARTIAFDSPRKGPSPHSSLAQDPASKTGHPGRTLPLVFDGLYRVAATVEGIQTNLIADTGALRTYVCGSLARRIAWPRPILTFDTKFDNEPARVNICLLSKLRVGQQVFKGPFKVGVVLQGHEGGSLFGLDILNGHRIVFDFPRHKIELGSGQ